MKAYLIDCRGQGDVHAALVSQETFDWINSFMNFERESTLIDKTVPSRQQECRKKQFGDDEIHITCGSYQNDRAMHVVSDVNGLEGEIFTDAIELQSAIREHGIVIEDTFEGYIY